MVINWNDALNRVPTWIKNKWINCYILQLSINNQNHYCIDTSVSLENIAIVKFDPNLHLGPKKRIFDIVNSKDRNDVTCCLSTVFFFLSFCEKS
mgnify:CR=1 FL=1